MKKMDLPRVFACLSCPCPFCFRKWKKWKKWIYRGFLHACPALARFVSENGKMDLPMFLHVFLALVHFVLWCGKWDVDSLSPELVVFGPKLYQVWNAVHVKTQQNVLSRGGGLPYICIWLIYCKLQPNLSIHCESDAPTRRHAESDYLVQWEASLPLVKVAVCCCHISMRKSGPTRAWTADLTVISRTL